MNEVLEDKIEYRNTKTRKVIDRIRYKGKWYTLKELTAMVKVSRSTLSQRIRDWGWTIAEAIETPPKGFRPSPPTKAYRKINDQQAALARLKKKGPQTSIPKPVDPVFKDRSKLDNYLLEKEIQSEVDWY